MRSFYVADEEIVHGESLGTAVVVAAGGEIDYAASPQLRELLARATHSGGAPVVVDLSEATFIDSTAIGVLVGAAAMLSEFGSEMAIVCTDKQILNIFGIVGLSEVVGISSSRDEALGSLAAHM
jgi:anti-sigma B factor antagonist